MKAKADQEVEFRIYEKSRSVLVLPKILFWLAFPLLSLVFLANLINIISGGPELDRAIPEFIATCFGFLIVMSVPFQIINQYNSIRTTKNGLYVNIYVFTHQWKFIPWEDVFEIKLSPLLDRWRNPVWVIKVKQLTYWHSLLSQYYRVNSGPGIVLTSDLRDRDRLLDIIDKRLSDKVPSKKKQNSTSGTVSEN